jgi:predicted deacetylase
VVLHGWTHRDEVPLSGGWRDAWLRRIYTAGEGEFAALSYEQAGSRLALGRAWMAGHGLSAQGFVAPAWLMSEPSWRAVAAARFRYTCTLTTLVALPQRHALHSRSLVFSTRSAGRRVLSVAWNQLQAVLQQRQPLLRLELHPCDADFPGVLACWTQVLRQALRQRQTMTLGQACDRWWPGDELREPSHADRPAGPVTPQGL